MKIFLELCAVFMLFYCGEIGAMFSDEEVLLPEMSRTTERMVSHRDNLFSKVEVAINNKDNRMVEILAKAACCYRFRDWNEDQKEILLFYSVKNDLEEIVECCADSGFDLNVTDKDGKTPLIIAIERDNCDIVEYLLMSEANPNAVDLCTGFSPLMIASMKGNKRIVKMLISEKADVNAASYKGYTALALAKKYKYPGIAQMLIKAGSNVNGDIPTSMDLYYYQKQAGNHRRKFDTTIDMLEKTESQANEKNAKPSNRIGSFVWSFFQSLFGR